MIRISISKRTKNINKIIKITQERKVEKSI